MMPVESGIDHVFFRLSLRRIRHVAAIALVLGLSACATTGRKPPVQEMSNARQAVQAAVDADARIHAGGALTYAEQLLSKAEHELRGHNYINARMDAVDARSSAVKARNMSLAIAEAKAAMTRADAASVPATEARAVLERAIAAADRGDEDQAVAHAGQARQLAETDIQAAEAARRAAEQENRDYLSRAQPLLDEAHAHPGRLSEDQANALHQAEQVYNAGRGREAYDIANTLVQALRAAPPPIPPSPPPPPPVIHEYTVKQGDSLWGIAALPYIYGNPHYWPLIYKANRRLLHDADLIRPGMVLKIPRDLTQDELLSALHHAHHHSH